eukprot:TRINITY_DN7040_c0_g2_i1.p1 TRINITY_DN7040_c0_g2~~TRINITY_DN7040_c0_g2_i1.p1  ORF type:complete len:105 (-),score=10.98 TRINITY_DN7040_c0_g2_i1:51-365(-)
MRGRVAARHVPRMALIAAALALWLGGTGSYVAAARTPGGRRRAEMLPDTLRRSRRSNHESMCPRYKCDVPSCGTALNGAVKQLQSRSDGSSARATRTRHAACRP